jgi:hypothetical protein
MKKSKKWKDLKSEWNPTSLKQAMTNYTAEEMERGVSDANDILGMKKSAFIALQFRA